MELVLETQQQQNKTVAVGDAGMMTPFVEPEYWQYRVKLSDKQAIVGFPKFFTIGVGFAVEEDWNTNFPYTCTTSDIFEHIKHNQGDDGIADEDVLEAIRMVQAAARAGRGDV